MSAKFMSKRPTVEILLQEAAPFAVDFDCTLTLESADGTHAGRLRYHFDDSPDDQFIDVKINQRRRCGHFVVEILKHLGVTDIIKEKYVVSAKGSCLFGMICLTDI